MKGFKTGDTYFIINLAIADLFKSSVFGPMNVISSFYGTWIFGQSGKIHFYDLLRNTTDLELK